MVRKILKTAKRALITLTAASLAWGLLAYGSWRSATAAINDAEDSLTASRTVTDQAENIIKMDEADGLRSGDVDELEKALDHYLQSKPAVPSIDIGDWKTMLALPLTAGETKAKAAAAKTAGTDGLHALQAELESATKSYYNALRAKIASSGSEWENRLGDLYEGSPSNAIESVRRPATWTRYSELYELATGLHDKYADMQALLEQVVAELHAKEAEAAGITVADGETGDAVMARVNQLASTMGVQVVPSPSTSCSGDPAPGSRVVGYYCQGYEDSRDKIFLNASNPNWSALQNDPWLLDVVKHELAHRSILVTCGTIDPSIVGGRTEAVTNSYAYAYYGADRARTESNQQGLAEYAADPTTDAIAGEIHEGKCS